MTSPAAQKPSGPAHRRSIALFGGTFDPVHAGHIAVAQAAQRRFHLDAIHFIPSSRPPHKSQQELTPFIHRYTMVALACAEHPGFVPSLAEAPPPHPHVFYSIDTVRKFRREHPDDHIYFIIGADQFLEFPTWKNYEQLLDSCDFVVASRPGFRLDALRLIVPPDKLGHSSPSDQHKIVLRKSVVHLLNTVASHVSSTEVRDRLLQKQGIHGLVPARVEEYIQGQALYR
ncbi:MAG TPA: nicotinate-nucleotide adenylyltransferase [Candidatus Dormibacteraeota bacterium]|nr:nicotinate-nucleotide adenylyltransferase [Candidatus Dormibacteraeota bacterium]